MNLKKTIKMKKIAAIILTAIALVSNAQTTKDSVYIVEYKDDMEDKVYYFPSKELVCPDPLNKKRGFIISFFISGEIGDLQAKEIKTKIVNVGSCHEKDEIIFLFEDGTKEKGIMWNEFNCEDKAWFKITKDTKNKLAENKLLKIKVENGRSYESFTYEVPVKDQDYFIQFFYALNNNKIKQSK